MSKYPVVAPSEYFIEDLTNLDYVASIESDVLKNIIVYQIYEDDTRKFLFELIVDKTDYATRVKISLAISVVRGIIASGGEFTEIKYPGFSFHRDREALSAIR